MLKTIIGVGLALVVSLAPVEVSKPVDTVDVVDVSVDIGTAVGSGGLEMNTDRTEITVEPYPFAELAVPIKVEQVQTTGSAMWQAIGNCESGNNYRAVNPAGYYGRWQFNQQTWNGNALAAGRSDLVGVRPDQASPADQDLVRDELHSRRGLQPWECASKLGFY